MTHHGHIPVLLDEVVSLLSPTSGETYVDCTAGLGGHAAAIGTKLGGEGRVVLNDLDAGNLTRAEEHVRETAGAAVEVVHGSFGDLPRELAARGIGVDLVLADLGFASGQVEDASRGFAFSRDGPLDMRFDRSRGMSAADVIAETPERDLASLIREFGEEPAARRIARKIVETRLDRPISTTQALADIVRAACPGGGVRGGPRGRGGKGSGGGRRIDPATRTFQALRIVVNDELGALDRLLSAVTQAAERTRQQTETWLRPGARVGIISFHSLEDRRVKRAFAALAERGHGELVTRKPVRGTEAEIERNPRARSAKLRVFRLGG